MGGAERGLQINKFRLGNLLGGASGGDGVLGFAGTQLLLFKVRGEGPMGFFDEALLLFVLLGLCPGAIRLILQNSLQVRGFFLKLDFLFGQGRFKTGESFSLLTDLLLP